MADNTTTQSTTPATLSAGVVIACRTVTYSGDANAIVAPVGLVGFSGSDDAKTATDIPAGGGTEATALRVTLASDSTGLISVDDNGGSLTVDGTVAVSGSVAVTGTFFQVTQPVSAAALPLPSGAATSALQTQPGVDIGDVTINNASGGSAVHIQDGGNSITVDGTVATTNAGTFVVQENGAALTALQLIDDTVFVDDAAFTPGTSKLNIIGAQADQTSPDSVDEGDAGALRMTLSRMLLTAQVCDVATLSNVASAATSATVLAANVLRVGCIIQNDDANALLLKYGATASATSYTVNIPGGGYWEMPRPVYRGILDGIWTADGSGSARVTELT